MKLTTSSHIIFKSAIGMDPPPAVVEVMSFMVDTIFLIYSLTLLFKSR